LKFAKIAKAEGKIYVVSLAETWIEIDDTGKDEES